MNDDKKIINDVTSSEKESTKTTKKANKPQKSKGGFKAFLKSRKAKHGSVAAAIVAVVIVLTIVLNVIFGLLNERFPEIALDLTSNGSFELQNDTVDYMSHLKKDVTVNILLTKDAFESQGSYFVQAQKLLEKMESKSNGKLKVKYVDLASEPTFASKYPNVDWSSTTTKYVALTVCDKEYKALTLEDCFAYDEATYSYYGSYSFTGTKIEQAVVTAILNVTTEDKPIVNIITGNQEQDYSGIKKLLDNNAYAVEEISLATTSLNNEAKLAVLFAPSVDLDEGAIEKLSVWLENDSKYGRSLIYVPSPEKVDTPNLDDFLEEWGMQVNDGYVYETNASRLVWNDTNFAFILDYSDYYKNNLKNPNIPVVISDTHDITITDDLKAHSLLTTSSDAGVQPYDADENWDYREDIAGEPLIVAAEGVKTNSDNKTSNLIVFGSYIMFNETVMQYNSFNNSAYLMNIVNTIAGKDDVGITIESKALESTELGVTDVATQNVLMVIFVILVPIAVFVAGIVVFIRRRNK